MVNIFYLEEIDLFVKSKLCNDEEPCTHCCVNNYKEPSDAIALMSCTGYKICSSSAEMYLVPATHAEILAFLGKANGYITRQNDALKIIRSMFGATLTQPLPAKLKKQCNKTGRILRLK